MTAVALPERVVAPRPADNQVDAEGQRSRAQTARGIVEAHAAGLEARREADLLREKYLLHIDGSGDAQWADIFNGQRVEIPRDVSTYRRSENLLRPIVENAVAHHTTMPLRYFADSLPDRRSREKALLDSLFANHLAEVQDLNGLMAEALYLAMPAGFCPTHAYWRDDIVDAYEPVGVPETESMQVRGPGMIDCWLGNPFDHVFDRGAKRNVSYWSSYGRILPAQMVREHFAHLPEASKITGSTNMPSASVFQRIAREWRFEGLAVHGSPVINYRRNFKSDEELLYLICREVLPGVEPEWPNGRLQLVAVPGEADLRRGKGGGSGILLVDQDLPGGVFSWSLFYSHHRSDDIHGKPWIEDLDQLQVQLNIAISERWEFLRKMKGAPIVAAGGSIAEDVRDIGDGYSMLEIEPTMAPWAPRVMTWPTEVLNAYINEANDKRRALYTLGGYQAVSRGEAPGSRTPAKAIMQLQRADNTVHGPVNKRFRRSACDFMRLCHRQFKVYGDVGWMFQVSGDEYAHLVEPWVDNTKLSDQPPHYKLVNAFGSDPELQAQEVLQLMQVRGADGEVFLKTHEARRQYPNQRYFDPDADPAIVGKRRAKTVASAALNLTRELREETQFDVDDIGHPFVQRAAMLVFGKLETQYPRLRDDDLAAHLAAYSEITQDETADAIARMALMRRQDLYYNWQAERAQQMAQQQSPQQAALSEARTAESGGAVREAS